MQSRRLALAFLLALFASLPAAAQKLPCAPCAGVRVADAATAAGLAASLTEAAGRVGAELSPDEAPFVVAWSVAATADADTAASARAADAVRAAGATPWVTLVLTAPPPLLENQLALDSEIAAASRLARATGAAWYQLDWQPPGGPPADAAAWGSEYAYLLKRASVALSGAQAEARVVSAALRGPVGSERPRLEALYSHEVAGYLEAVAVASLGEAQVSAAGGAVDELDPGRPLVLDAVPFPPVAERALPLAARYTVAGAGLVLFDASRDAAPPTAAALAPLALMAREMAGDLS
ncbi:MAG TPA: hypothetical protein VKU40_15740, partial [Thermoanaerobaculia bacterium]|nr:hypothetical protein [Thermoanaerobaculia bacterium]